jgi:hypothetical protein
MFITTTLNGLCIARDFRALLLTGEAAAEVAAAAEAAGWRVLVQGEVPLTLGVRLFDRPFVFTPVKIITERNRPIEGEALFNWLAARGYTMPRSEVLGLDARGRDAQVFVRDIDIELSPAAIFKHGTLIAAMVEIEAAHTGEPQLLDRPELPERFREALKVYRAAPAADLSRLLD